MNQPFTIDADQALAGLASRLSVSARNTLALILAADSPERLSALVATVPPDQLTANATAFSALAAIPASPRLPGLNARLSKIAAEFQSAAQSRGLSAFDLGGLIGGAASAFGGASSIGGVAGGLFQGIGDVLGVLGSPALGPIVGVVGNVIGSAIGGNEPNLPQHDYNASNAQALAAAAARQLWTNGAGAVPVTAQQAQAPAGIPKEVIYGGFGLLALFLITRK